MAGSGRAAINAGRPSAVAMADWFGSGKLDLFIGTGDGYVYLFTNEGTRQKPVWRQSERLRAGGKTVIADGGDAGPFVADWDQDGKPDLLVGCGSGRVVWYRNSGTKTAPALAQGVTLIEPFTSNLSRKPETTRGPNRSGLEARICVADWNGDGLPDLIVGDSSRGHGWVWVYLRKPTETASLKNN